MNLTDLEHQRHNNRIWRLKAQRWLQYCTRQLGEPKAILVHPAEDNQPDVLVASFAFLYLTLHLSFGFMPMQEFELLLLSQDRAGAEELATVVHDLRGERQFSLGNQCTTPLQWHAVLAPVPQEIQTQLPKWKVLNLPLAYHYLTLVQDQEMNAAQQLGIVKWMELQGPALFNLSR